MTTRSRCDSEDSPRRARILSAAVDEFSAKGFAAARTDRIADRAGCNKGLIYYYFGSKEGLYNAVFEALIAEYRPFWSAIGDSTFDDWHQRRAEWELDPRARIWLRLLTMEGLSDDGTTPAPLEGERTRTWAELVKLVHRAQDGGELDPDLDSELVALMFSLWMVMPRVLPQMTRMITGLDADDPVFVERLTAFQRELRGRLRPHGDRAAADDRPAGQV